MSPSRAQNRISSSDFCEGMKDILRAEVENLSIPTATEPAILPVKQTVDLLASALDCVSEVLRASELDDTNADELFDQMSKYSDFNCVSDDKQISVTVRLARAVHQTVAILYNLVCNENPPGHASMESYVDGLLAAVNSVPLSVWNKVPALQLLV